MGERGRVTPRVVVESEEITALIIGTAVHVLGHFVSVAVHVGSRVTNWDGAVASAVTVLLEIASHSLDIRGTVGGVVIVDDLVTTEEEKSVGVVGEGIDSCEDTLQVDSIVRSAGVTTVERVQRSVDILLLD